MKCRVPVQESIEQPQRGASFGNKPLALARYSGMVIWRKYTQQVTTMDYDEEKIDEAVLALLYLTMWDDRRGTRAWKGHDWAAMDRLHQKGYIGDPKGKARSVVVTEQGRARAEELFHRLFTKTR